MSIPILQVNRSGIIKPVNVPSIKNTNGLQEKLFELGISLPVDDKILTAKEGSPLAQAIRIGGFNVGNRFCIQPMEGWDGTEDGKPTENVLRRWRRFGESGAKLIWGCEAVAVDRRYRANPNQLCFGGNNHIELRKALSQLKEAHIKRHGHAEDLLVGLQLTHSGRFCKPNDKRKFEPIIAYHHPILDKKFGINPSDDSVVITDEQIQELIKKYVLAAKQTYEAGFQFVDVKACHGYLLHEFLSAFSRHGPYGGEDLENRSRLLCEIIKRIKKEVPNLMIGVRLSAFDTVPFIPDPQRGVGDKLGPGIPEDFSQHLPYPIFGANRTNPLEVDLTEPIQLIQKLKDLGVELFNITAGSPYYCPHIQRPARYPPSDGYQPPEDPLVGVARQMYVTRDLKAQFPELPMVGTAYTYFQEFLPRVAQAAVRQSWVDSIGIGRMVLSYPELPSDVLEKGELNHRKICRTFSDCTTGPRGGLESGCFPLDEHYQGTSSAQQLLQIKQNLAEQTRAKNQAAQATLAAKS